MSGHGASSTCALYYCILNDIWNKEEEVVKHSTSVVRAFLTSALAEDNMFDLGR